MIGWVIGTSDLFRCESGLLSRSSSGFRVGCVPLRECVSLFMEEQVSSWWNRHPRGVHVGELGEIGIPCPGLGLSCGSIT